MPLYSFRCAGCGAEFETLVTASQAAACPDCGGSALDRLLSAIAREGKSGKVISAARAQAAREGHFSNYSRSELKGKR